MQGPGASARASGFERNPRGTPSVTKDTRQRACVLDGLLAVGLAAFSPAAMEDPIRSAKRPVAEKTDAERQRPV